ncbi:MAG: sigma-70 family RNA polymerase sigma factor [Gemmiger sp.]
MQQFNADLLTQARQGDETALAAVIARMMPVIRRGAAANAVPGLDFDDAVQEGLIGLFRAVRSYNAVQGTPFPAYAARCISHAQADARRAAVCKKHAPLNTSVPLPEDSTAPGPEELAIAGERYERVLTHIESVLSTLERDALLQNLAGHSTVETARQLGCSEKAVENALGRARRKLRVLRKQ